MLYRNFQTQAELDAQYNPALAPGVDIPEYMVLYNVNSAKIRQEIPCKLNIAYGSTPAEQLDIFCAKQPNAPVLVFIHGGYWSMSDSKENSFIAKGLVDAGVTTVVINYALCPQVTIDEIVRQTRAAIAWVYRNAESFGGDRNRIYVSGHSAGGHLTAMAMITDWENDYGLPADIIKGGCTISGLFDLMPFPHTWLQPNLQLSADEVLRNSPINHIPEKAGSLIVTYGALETEEFARQSQDFLAVWKAKGLDGEYLPLPGKHHFATVVDFLDANSPLCSAVLELIRKTGNGE